MKKTQSHTLRGYKLLRITGYTICILLVLVVGLSYALTLPAVQQRLTREVQTYLQDKLGTRVEVGAVRVKFPYHLSLERFLLEDQQGDTLAQVGNLVIAVNMWKLFDKTIELQQITLEDARVNLLLKDSTYNFDFAVRAFAADTTPVAADTTASAWKMQFDLVDIQLKKVSFLLQDADSKSTTQANIGTATTVLAKADLKTMAFELDGFNLADTDIRLVETQIAPDDGIPAAAFAILLKNGDITRSHLLYSTPELAVDASLEKTQIDNLVVRSANDLLSIQTTGVRVINSAVNYRDPAMPSTPGHVNAGDLSFNQLNANLSAFSFQNDTLLVQANTFSGTDKSGLQVYSLRTTAKITPGSIEIKNALAHLNNTNIDGDIVLYQNNKAIFDRMQVHLRQVKGIVGDLIVLLPPQENTALAQLRDIPYEVSGKLNGWLDNLQTENIRFQAGSGTVANFTGSVQQLTLPDKLGMSLNISRLETNRADLIRWMSVGDTPMDSLLAQPLPAQLSILGTVSGTMAQLQLALRGTVGTLQKGAVFPPATGSPLQFDLAGNLTQANDPDQLGMDLRLNQLDVPRNFFSFLELNGGQMPDLLQATGTLRGNLAVLYTDLQFKALRDGANSHLNFKGPLKNLRTPDQLGFDIAFDGALARQEMLGYVPDSVTNGVRLPDFTQINGYARGTVQDAAAKINIGLDDWGQIAIDGTLLDSSYHLNLIAQNLHVNQLLIDSTLQPLKTVGMTAQISGEGFQFGQTARFQLVGKVDSVIWDNLILRGITLDADINGRQFSGGFQSPDDRFAVRARATGDFSTAIPMLTTDIALNCIDMREFGWTNRPTTVCMHILSRSEGLSLDTLMAHIRIEDIDLQYDTVHIQPGNLTLDLRLDNRQNSIQIASDWLQGEIKGYFVLTDLSTTIANIAEQYFVVDRTTYTPPTGTDSLSVQLRLLRTSVLTTGLIPGLTELDPVSIEGTLVAQRNYFNLRIQAPRMVYLEWAVDSLNVRAYAGDTAALFVLTTPLVQRGEENFVENAVLNGRFLANIADISFKAVNDDGRDRFLLAVQALLNNTTKETVVTLAPQQVIDYKIWTVNADNEIRIAPDGVAVRKFDLTGNGQSIQVDGTTRKLANNKTGLNFAVDIDRLNYNNFDIFVAGILRELGGWADAHLTINGSTDAPLVRGNIQLHETFFTPTMTNVRYTLSETPLEFTESGINLDGLTLSDAYGKTLAIKGTLATKDWQNIESNLSLHADQWQVLNSTRQQNPVYFGELYVSLDGTIRGPVSKPDIRVVVKTAKASTFTYVYDVATQALQHEGIVYFLPPPRQNVRPPIYDAPVITQPFTLSASVEIDSNLTISSVINPVTGDDFRGKATGRLQFDLLANGNMTLAGQVELVRGVYNYSYQSVVKRSFEVTNGSTITWTGDPLLPELALKARYQFKASPYPLVINQLSTASADEAAAYRKTQTFFLQTSINGSATQPDVSFQFIYPSDEKQENLSASFGAQQSDLVQSAVSNVNQDKNLLSRQVFGVLLLRNFIGETVGTITTTSGANPLQAGLSSFLTGQINALADQYLTWIDVDLATTEGTSGKGTNTQADGSTNYQLRLQKSFFEDRLTFKISGGTSVGGSGTDGTQSALENASVEYALTPNGVLKVTVFSENGFDLLNATSGNLRNSGGGLILSKEFGGKK